MPVEAKSGDTLNHVLFGDDGWLFLWQGGQNQFDYLMGVRTPSPLSITAFSENIDSRRAMCEARGLPYLHVVYPSKPLVMTEFVPENIRGDVRSLFERHYLPTLTEAARDTILYPRAMLRAALEQGQMFSLRDTHMTAAGNALVSREILRGLGYDHDPGAHMDIVNGSRLGDLASMIGVTETIPEAYLIPRGGRLYSVNNFAALPGNTDSIDIYHNPCSSSTQRLLALGDSFLRAGLPSLSTFFRDILYVRSDVFQPELLELFAPDAVVTASAERFICNIRPDSNAESVLLRGYGREGYQPTPDFVAALKAQLSRRSYPDRYVEWASRIDTGVFGPLGKPRMNMQIVPTLGRSGLFDVNGTDPQILFTSPDITAGQAYRLRIVMESDVHSNAQLFMGLADQDAYRFAEASSLRRPVGVGTNDLDFEITAEGRGQYLRFDPLQGPGRIRIVSVELTAVAQTAEQVR